MFVHLMWLDLNHTDCLWALATAAVCGIIAVENAKSKLYKDSNITTHCYIVYCSNTKYLDTCIAATQRCPCV